MSPAAAPSPQLHPRIQELIEYLAEHRRGLHEAVAAVPASLRERRPAPDRWSVAEVVEHVSLVEHRVATLLTRKVLAARANGAGPDPETSSVVATYADPHAVVDRSRKFSAPALVHPTGAVDTTAGTEALVQAHAAMVSSLQNANGVDLTPLSATHPALGLLNMYHWVVALALHDDRHAAQIREIGQSLGASQWRESHA
jgi:DinB family protein